MKITFKQLEKKINNGSVGIIYLSTVSLWFTHDPRDVRRATKIGRKAQKTLLREHLADPKVPKDNKTFIRKLAKESRKEAPVPLDPGGNPLIVNSNPKDWLKSCKRDPFHYGRYTFKAFMRAHAKNCKDVVFQTWGEVQDLLDREQKIK